MYNEKLTCEEFRKKYLSKNSSAEVKSLPDLVGNLSHYVDDEDLRAKDPEYKKMQYSELLKLISLLEKSAPLESLREIHFLGPTK